MRAWSSANTGGKRMIVCWALGCWSFHDLVLGDPKVVRRNGGSLVLQTFVEVFCHFIWLNSRSCVVGSHHSNGRG